MSAYQEKDHSHTNDQTIISSLYVLIAITSMHCILEKKLIDVIRDRPRNSYMFSIGTEMFKGNTSWMASIPDVRCLITRLFYLERMAKIHIYIAHRSTESVFEY